MLEDFLEALKQAHIEIEFDQDTLKIIKSLSDEQLVGLKQSIIYFDTNKMSNIELLSNAAAEELQSSNRAPDYLLKQFFIELESNKIYVHDDTKEAIKKLKVRQLNRLSQIVYDLRKFNLLDTEAFNKALERLTTKVPRVEESTVEKHSRKGTDNKQSTLKIGDDLELSMGHGKENKISEGKRKIIRKAYEKYSKDSREPEYAIKYIGRNDKDEYESGQEKIAEREARYSRLLGHPTRWYSREGKKPAVVTTWAKDSKALDSTGLNIIEMPFEKRMNCLVSFFTQLNILHNQNMMHGDIVNKNIMINTNAGIMRIIDFETAGPSGVNKALSGMEFKMLENMTVDVYHAQAIVKRLFPEIRFGAKKGSTESNALNGIQQQAVKNLVEALVQTLCTSEDALHYCKKVIGLGDKLSEVTLKEISESTIKRHEVTVEDVLRRPGLGSK